MIKPPPSFLGPVFMLVQSWLQRFLHRMDSAPQMNVRLLIPDKIIDKDGLASWEQFMTRVHEKLGPQVLPRELEDII